MIGEGHEQLEESYLAETRLHPRANAQAVLDVTDLSLDGAYRGVSFDVRAGEVLGIYGFLGCGQLELARTLFGRLPADHGRIAVGGRTVHLSSTPRARRAGMAFVPESRRLMLFGAEPIYKNVSISILERIDRLWSAPGVERAIAERHVASLRIRPPEVGLALRTLSGGNQQKVALAKWLTELPRVLVLSEPTRGMDVGAKEDVVAIVRGLRERGWRSWWFRPSRKRCFRSPTGSW